MSTVVLTGGTDGIGRALAERLLHRGDRVVVVARDPDRARARLPGAVVVAADLSLVSRR